jgi:nickel/cobalt transporter (NicO) family protein
VPSLYDHHQAPIHDHDHDHHHGHSHPQRSGRSRRLSLVGAGIVGGLVPSRSALIVLLGAVGLGRTASGVLPVVACGVGMAATPTAAGLVPLRVRDRWTSRPRRTLARLAALAPADTAALVICLGLGLAGRAALGVVNGACVLNQAKGDNVH